MKTSTRLFSALAVGVFLSLGLIAVPAAAQDKGKETKAAPAFPKEGNASAGAQRPWRGRSGQVGNGQAGIYLASVGQGLGQPA